METNSHTTSPAHTPGPWYAELVDLIVYAKDGAKVAVVHQQVEPTEDSDVTSANARLIAAAPDLLRVATSAAATYQDRLDLLEEEREWQGDDEADDMIAHYTSLLDTAKAAIARATTD